MPRCVVLRALGLGDLLTGIPALRLLRNALPEWRIDLAAPAQLTPLVRLAGAVDGIVDTPDLGPVPWSGPLPELAVDLHGNGPASKGVLQVLEPQRLLAFAGPDHHGTPVQGPAWRRDEHEVARWCRLVREGLGLPADLPPVLGDGTDAAALRIARPACAGPPHSGSVVIHPGAASGSRRWPAERFAAVASVLADEAAVHITGSPDEAALTDDVRRRAGLPPEADLAGCTDLFDLARTVAEAQVVISGDTGIAHLASALGTPSVVLFGPIPPAWWGPPPGPHVALWHGRPGEVGDPHGAEPDPRLLRIGVEEVLAAVDALLGPRTGRASGLAG
jgi:ADP-heptose:LPS heptosyltransferase